MSALSERLEPYKLRAQRHKKAAVRARTEGNAELAKEEFEEAQYAIEDAFEEILLRGELSPEVSGQLDQGAKDQAFELADCWGIRGGIYRVQGDFENAIASYERGYAFESNPAFAIYSTYNTVNRLVLRLLTRSDLLEPGAPAVSDGKPIATLLEEAAAAIKQKWRQITNPAWALADMVMIEALLEKPDLPEWEELFQTHATDRFPFDSLGAVVKVLAGKRVPAAQVLSTLARRLEADAAELWPQQASAS